MTNVPGELGCDKSGELGCDKSLTEIEICEADPRLRVCLVERDGLEERLARTLRPLVGERALRLVGERAEREALVCGKQRRRRTLRDAGLVRRGGVA